MIVQRSPARHVMTRLNTAALYIAGIGLVIMTIIVGAQVFFRYVMNDSPSWTEPAAVLLMSWFIYLGAAVGVRENNHMGFDVILYVLPPAGKRWLRTISDLAILVFGIGMVFYGIRLFNLTYATVLPSLGISGAIQFIPLIAGGVLVVLFALERLVLRFQGYRIDDVLDDIAPTEVAAEMNNVNPRETEVPDVSGAKFKNISKE